MFICYLIYEFQAVHYGYQGRKLIQNKVMFLILHDLCHSFKVLTDKIQCVKHICPLFVVRPMDVFSVIIFTHNGYYVNDSL